MKLIFPDPFSEIEWIRKTFKPGDFVVYEFRKLNNGIKHTCSVVSISDDGWVVDGNAGSCFSVSFRPRDVIIWEHGKKKSEVRTPPKNKRDKKE